MSKQKKMCDFWRTGSERVIFNGKPCLMITTGCKGKRAHFSPKNISFPSDKKAR